MCEYISGIVCNDVINHILDWVWGSNLNLLEMYFVMNIRINKWNCHFILADNKVEGPRMTIIGLFFIFCWSLVGRLVELVKFDGGERQVYIGQGENNYKIDKKYYDDQNKKGRTCLSYQYFWWWQKHEILWIYICKVRYSNYVPKIDPSQCCDYNCKISCCFGEECLCIRLNQGEIPYTRN